MANVLGFRDYIFIIIFNDRPVVGLGARETDKKMLASLVLAGSNTAGTIPVFLSKESRLMPALY
jgi:hypothetical protein